MDLSDFGVEQKEKEAQSLQARADRATADVERLNQQILALSDEYDTRLKQRRELYKKKFDERFKDVNVKAALVGASARYAQLFSGASYFFEMPTGDWNAQISAFLNNPRSTEKVKDGDIEREINTDWAPIQPEEVVLMKMLTGFQAPGAQETAFKGKTPYQRLRAIRGWPIALIGALADRAATFESYLNCCLELDLGN